MQQGGSSQSSLVALHATLLFVLPQAAIDGNPALAAVSGDFGAVAALFANVSASVDALEVALSYSTFHPVSAKCHPQQLARCRQ